MAPFLGAWADHFGFAIKFGKYFPTCQKGSQHEIFLQETDLLFLLPFESGFHTPALFVWWNSFLSRYFCGVTDIARSCESTAQSYKWAIRSDIKFLSWLKQKLEWRRIYGDFSYLREHLNVIQIVPFIWERNYPASLQLSCIYINLSEDAKCIAIKALSKKLGSRVNKLGYTMSNLFLGPIDHLKIILTMCLWMKMEIPGKK